MERVNWLPRLMRTGIWGVYRGVFLGGEGFISRLVYSIRYLVLREDDSHDSGLNGLFESKRVCSSNN